MQHDSRKEPHTQINLRLAILTCYCTLKNINDFEFGVSLKIKFWYSSLPNVSVMLNLKLGVYWVYVFWKIVLICLYNVLSKHPCEKCIFKLKQPGNSSKVWKSLDDPNPRPPFQNRSNSMPTPGSKKDGKKPVMSQSRSGRVSVSNENNVLLDPEVLTDYPTQVLVLTVLVCSSVFSDILSLSLSACSFATLFLLFVKRLLELPVMLVL